MNKTLKELKLGQDRGDWGRFRTFMIRLGKVLFKTCKPWAPLKFVLH